jgi:tricorn protease
MIGEQTGIAKPRAISLPSSAFSPSSRGHPMASSSRSRTIISTSGRSTSRAEGDEDRFRHVRRSGRVDRPVWSPDSRWIAYSKNLDNHPRDLRVLVRRRKIVSDHRRHVRRDLARVRRIGKYLYFLASTNYGPNVGWLEMSSHERPVRRSVYLGVCSATEPSPLLPEAGDEPARHRARRCAAGRRWPALRRCVRRRPSPTPRRASTSRA